MLSLIAEYCGFAALISAFFVASACWTAIAMRLIRGGRHGRD